MISKIRMI